MFAISARCKMNQNGLPLSIETSRMQRSFRPRRSQHKTRVEAKENTYFCARMKISTQILFFRIQFASMRLACSHSNTFCSMFEHFTFFNWFLLHFRSETRKQRQTFIQKRKKDNNNIFDNKIKQIKQKNDYVEWTEQPWNRENFFLTFDIETQSAAEKPRTRTHERRMKRRKAVHCGWNELIQYIQYM